MGYYISFDTRLSQNTNAGEHIMQISTSQPPSLEIGYEQDSHDIKMTTLSKTFKSFISYIDESKKLGDSVKRAMHD